MRASKSSRKPQLVAAGKHHTMALQQTLQVFFFQNILPGTNMYYANICAANSCKGMMIAFANFVRYSRCGSNHFYTGITTTHFKHDTAQNTQFKKVKIVLMNVSFFC